MITFTIVSYHFIEDKSKLRILFKGKQMNQRTPEENDYKIG